MKRILPRVAATLAAVLGGLYLYAAADLYFRQSAYIYHPKPEWTLTPRDLGLEFEDVSFRAGDGTRLSGWFVPAKGARRGTVLFCHGNAGNISSESIPIKLYTEIGFDIFLFDYRGFGKSEGTPDEKGTTLDADAAWEHLVKTRGIPPAEIVILGRSFGAAVAIPLAVRRSAAGDKPRALFVEAAFTSLADIGERLHPYFPVRLLIRSRYESLRSIPQVRCPILVVHSHEDELIPFEHGRRLVEAAPEPKTFLDITGPHNNKNDPVSQAQYRQGVIKYLDRIFPPR